MFRGDYRGVLGLLLELSDDVLEHEDLVLEFGLLLLDLFERFLELLLCLRLLSVL